MNNQHLTYTFCPEHGYGVNCDEDGCCVACGCTATGHGVEDIMNALDTALKNTDGVHHKDWIIDQVVRHLTGGMYDQFVKMAKHGEFGPNTYNWDTGTAP